MSTSKMEQIMAMVLAQRGPAHCTGKIQKQKRGLRIRTGSS